jgi:hypothetical protein
MLFQFYRSFWHIELSARYLLYKYAQIKLLILLRNVLQIIVANIEMVHSFSSV